jgi:hypothetical protein
MLDKFKIKQFVHDSIHMARGLAAKLAKSYGKSEFWISDILSASSETDGHVYGYLLFMERVAEESPEALAMIDDEVRRIVDELKMPGQSGRSNESVDVLLEAASKAYTQLLTAYRTRQGRGELKAATAKLSAQVNQLMQVLDPPRGRPLGGNDDIKKLDGRAM